jgi:hypothetical protein
MKDREDLKDDIIETQKDYIRVLEMENATLWGQYWARENPRTPLSEKQKKHKAMDEAQERLKKWRYDR